MNCVGVTCLSVVELCGRLDSFPPYLADTSFQVPINLWSTFAGPLGSSARQVAVRPARVIITATHGIRLNFKKPVIAILRKNQQMSLIVSIQLLLGGRLVSFSPVAEFARILANSATRERKLALANQDGNNGNHHSGWPISLESPGVGDHRSVAELHAIAPGKVDLTDAARI